MPTFLTFFNALLRDSVSDFNGCYFRNVSFDQKERKKEKNPEYFYVLKNWQSAFLSPNEKNRVPLNNYEQSAVIHSFF